VDKDRKYLLKYVNAYPSISAAAAAWGVSRNGLWMILDGQRGIGRDVYFKLLNAIEGIDPVRLANIRQEKRV
jgi:hypothetical protein